MARLGPAPRLASVFRTRARAKRSPPTSSGIGLTSPPGASLPGHGVPWARQGKAVTVMSRMLRVIVVYVAIVVLAGVGANLAAASETTPDPGAVDPRLAGNAAMTITITDDAVVAPAEVPAGPTLVTQVNLTDEDAHFFILRIPDEVSDEQVAATLESSVIPDWLSAAQLVGNPDRAAPGGGGAVALVDLRPARYLVMDPTHPREPAAFLAVGEPVPLPEVAADVRATMFEMDFAMPASVPAGKRIWEVANTGSMLHELAVIPVPAGATAEQVLLAIQPAWEGTPLPSELGEEWTTWSPHPVAGVGATSPGGRVYAQIDLEPGAYVAVCFVPTDDFTPHLMLGMTRIFTVTEAAV